MAAEFKVKNIVKAAKRKVNLRSISSEYDIIEHGSILSAEVVYEDEADLLEASRRIANLARKCVDEDIRNNIIALKEMAKDIKKGAELGISKEIEYSEEEAKKIISDDYDFIGRDIDIQNEASKLVEKEIEDPEKVSLNISLDEEDSALLDDLLTGEAKNNKESKKEVKEKTKESLKLGLEEETEDEEKSNIKDVDDLDFSSENDLGFLNDVIGIEENSEEDKSEENKKETNNKKEDVSESKLYEEVDLDDFHEEDAAGDLFQ
jgi:hypothetical protein